MKLPEIPREPAETVTLRPVFRYADSPVRGRKWLWVTGAALLLAVAATFLFPVVT